MRAVMKLYHRTTSEAADQILAEGFRDNTDNYGVEGHSFTGVWVSDVPLDRNEGAWGDVLLQITLDVSESELADYEWVEEWPEIEGGKRYREWLVPEQ